jgi:membrane protein
MLEGKKNKEWYDNSRIISLLAIISSLIVVGIGQSLTIKMGFSTGGVFSNRLNANFMYLIMALYFALINFKIGKKYFNYLNLGIIILHGIIGVTSIFTVIQLSSSGTINFLAALISSILNISIFIYMLYSLFLGTRYYEEFKLSNSLLNEFSNDNYFYSIVIVSLFITLINIFTINLDTVHLYVFKSIYTILLARYIYLYREYYNDDSDKLFSEIKEIREDVPHIKTIKNNVSKTKFNFYQKFSIVLFLILLVVGAILGNSYPVCSNKIVYSSLCEFNILLMLEVWFGSLALCFLYFELGKIIELLSKRGKK